MDFKTASDRGDAFRQRLRSALQSAGCSTSPTEFAQEFNLRTDRLSVTSHTVRMAKRRGNSAAGQITYPVPLAVPPASMAALRRRSKFQYRRRRERFQRSAKRRPHPARVPSVRCPARPARAGTSRREAGCLKMLTRIGGEPQTERPTRAIFTPRLHEEVSF